MSQMKVEYLMNLCLLCNTFHKMAEEVYYTGIEEFSEVCEGFTPGTIGSSTMPQKIQSQAGKGNHSEFPEAVFSSGNGTLFGCADV